MNFISTRGKEKFTFLQAVLMGYAPDGGLFVPEKLPLLTAEELNGFAELSYAERAAKIFEKFLDGVDADELSAACDDAFKAFLDDDPVPLVKLDDGVYMLELWHGATCSYADLSLATAPYLLKKAVEESNFDGSVLILCDTAGDMGKAAMEYFKDEKNFKVAVLYPAEGVSKMQKLQLGVQDGENVEVLGVKGDLDDCRKAVERVLSNADVSAALKEKNTIVTTLSSVNPAVVIAEIAFFVSAYVDLVSSSQIELGEQVDFTLPCGSLGSAVAGYYAKLMGLPIRRLHCASNKNGALAAFFTNGTFDATGELYKTTAPAMDISVPANLERLIFEACGRDCRAAAKKMQQLKDSGKCDISAGELAVLTAVFDGGTATDDESVEAMYDVFCDVGYTMDTHTGCAMKVAVDWFERHKKDETNAVIFSCANAYKFPQDVLYAVTGNDVKDSFKGVKRLHAATAMAVPKCLKDLKDKTPRFTKTVAVGKVAEEIIAFLQK